MFKGFGVGGLGIGALLILRYLFHICTKDVNLTNGKNASLLGENRLLNLNGIPNALEANFSSVIG